MIKRNLKGLTRAELKEFVHSIGEPPFRAEQIYKWIYSHNAVAFDEMTNLPKNFREKLTDIAYIGALMVRARQVSERDGTTKYLYELEDGSLIESVTLVHDYGRSACVSSQVGCRMGCSFCASTLSGLVRNLEPWEMADQILAMTRDCGVKNSQEPSKRISSVVVMGSGEPLENYDNLLKFIDLINDPEGLSIGYRHITVSTCGIPDKMLELAKTGMQITLAVSLHAPNNELRNRLMPINRKHPLSSLMETCKEYVALSGRRITFEYALVDGVNDQTAHAVELAELVGGILCHINLIPLNPVAERSYNPAVRERVDGFRSYLESKGIPVTVRRELGRDIDAACGQLRRRVMENMAVK